MRYFITYVRILKQKKIIQAVVRKYFIIRHSQNEKKIKEKREIKVNEILRL